MSRSLSKFWDREDSLTVFLWLLVVFVFIVGPASHLVPRYRILIELSFGIVLISGIWATIESRRLALLGVCFVLLSICSAVVKITFSHIYIVKLISELSDAMAVSLFLFVVFKQTMKAGAIDRHRIKGAIASYLLLAVLWGKLYYCLLLALPGSFSGVDTQDPFVSLIYFSFVTLTSVGYGDILPLHVFPRALANAEALIGQLFPAIFIARLVSLEVDQRKR